MIIDKFQLFERLSIGGIERGEHITILNESNLDEGIFSSITNFFSRMLGGSVAKLDKIITKYKDNEVDYWVEWADIRGKFDEADALSKEAKADPVQKMKYEEQKERIKKLQTQLENKRKDVTDALIRQSTGIIKDSERLKDYWEMKKAVADEDVAKDSYTEVKKSTDDETIHDLFDIEIQNAVKIAKEKNDAFKDKYGDLSGGSFFDQVPTDNDDLTVSGIKIKTLISSPLEELKVKMKSLSNERLDDVLKYFEKELKKIKDQRDDDIKNVRNRTQDKAQASKEADDLARKVRIVIDNIQAKIDYIDQLSLSSKGLKQEIKRNPDIVTDATTKELGVEGTDKAVVNAIAKTAETVKKPDAAKVELVITDQVKKNFTSAKSTVEESIGKQIEDSHYAHIKNDMIVLYGKLVFYYKDLNKDVTSKTLEFGLIDFAAELYKYKEKNNVLTKDLSVKELDELFQKYEK